MCSIFYSFSFLPYKFLDAKTEGEVSDCGYRTAKHTKNAKNGFTLAFLSYSELRSFLAGINNWLLRGICSKIPHADACCFRQGSVRF